MVEQAGQAVGLRIAPWAAAIVIQVGLLGATYGVCRAVSPEATETYWRQFGILLLLVGMALSVWLAEQILLTLFLRTIEDHVLPALPRAEDRRALYESLDDMYDPWRQVVFAGLFGVVASLPMIVEYLHLVDASDPYAAAVHHVGPVIFMAVHGVQAAFALSFVPPGAALVWRLPRFRWKLNPLDPARTEVLLRMNLVNTAILYTMATVLAAMGLISNQMDIFTNSILSVMTFIVVSWIPLLGLFVGAHVTFVRIIQEAKWRVLAPLDEHCKNLVWAPESGAPTWTMPDELDQALKLRDRLLATPSSLMGQGAVVNLLNSMTLAAGALVLPPVTAWVQTAVATLLT